jgi:hypothetical protein
MAYKIHSFGLSRQASSTPRSEWIERRTDLAFPLPRSLRNIFDARSAVNAQPALSITTAGSLTSIDGTGSGVLQLERSADCEIGVRENRFDGDANRPGFRNAFQDFCGEGFCLRSLDPRAREMPVSVDGARCFGERALTMIPAHWKLHPAIISMLPPMAA